MSALRIFKIFQLIIIIGLFFIACESENIPSIIVKKDKSSHFHPAIMKKMIQEKNNQFTKAHITGDQAAIDTMFTPDAKSFPPHAAPVSGRSAIAALTKQYIEFGVAEFHEETTEIYGCDDLLIDQGTYSMTYGKDNTVEHGKYLNVWKKVDGQWKIYSNMWNTNE